MIKLIMPRSHDLIALIMWPYPRLENGHMKQEDETYIVNMIIMLWLVFSSGMKEFSHDENNDWIRSYYS